MRQENTLPFLKMETLNRLGIVTKKEQRLATEGHWLGSLFSHGFHDDIVIVSDDAVCLISPSAGSMWKGIIANLYGICYYIPSSLTFFQKGGDSFFGFVRIN